MEDLPYLESRHRLSLLMADTAADGCSRASHAGLARGYGLRIAALRRTTPARDGSAL